jgi:hypothetical protein
MVAASYDRFTLGTGCSAIRDRGLSANDGSIAT